MKKNENKKLLITKKNNYVKMNYYNYMPIFTDGSKNSQSEHVGAGVYIPEFNVEISKIIIDGVSVFTSEIVAIILGLQWIEEVRPERVVIFFRLCCSS